MVIATRNPKPDPPRHKAIPIASVGNKRHIGGTASTTYAPGTATVDVAGYPLFSQPMDYRDIVQGWLIGDCWELVSTAGAAWKHPELFGDLLRQKDERHVAGDTYWPSFRGNGDVLQLQKSTFLVDSIMPAGGVKIGLPGTNLVSWPAYVEKMAMAYFSQGDVLDPNAINEGNPATWMYLMGFNVRGLGRAFDASMRAIFDKQYANGNYACCVTQQEAIPDDVPLDPNHCYLMMAFNKFWNPWNFDGKGHDNNPNDGIVTVEPAVAAQYIVDVQCTDGLLWTPSATSITRPKTGILPPPQKPPPITVAMP